MHDYTVVAYDEGLATRLLAILGGEPGLATRKMFGCLAILLDGNMARHVRRRPAPLGVPGVAHARSLPPK